MIKVSFFAALRETLNCSELQLNVTTPISIEQAKALIIKLHPNWESSFNNHSLLAAINHEMVDDASIVNPNDELAFFPPVTGG